MTRHLLHRGRALRAVVDPHWLVGFMARQQVSPADRAAAGITLAAHAFGLSIGEVEELISEQPAAVWQAMEGALDAAGQEISRLVKEPANG